MKSQKTTKDLFQEFMDTNDKLVEIERKLHEHDNIQICGIKKKIQVFKLESLEKIAKTFNKEITYVAFDHEQYPTMGFFYIDDISIYAIG